MSCQIHSLVLVLERKVVPNPAIWQCLQHVTVPGLVPCQIMGDVNQSIFLQFRFSSGEQHAGKITGNCRPAAQEVYLSGVENSAGCTALMYFLPSLPHSLTYIFLGAFCYGLNKSCQQIDRLVQLP